MMKYLVKIVEHNEKSGTRGKQKQGSSNGKQNMQKQV